MKLQPIYGDWYSISPTLAEDPEFAKCVQTLEDIPGVQTLESDTKEVLALELHRSHIPIIKGTLVPNGPGRLRTYDVHAKGGNRRRHRPGPSFSPKFELRDYQKEAVQFARSRQGSLFLHGLGLGKTIMALSACAPPSMAVVPAAAISVWEIEAGEMGMRTAVCRGKTVDKEILKSGADLFITTYNSLPYWAPFFKALSAGPALDTLIMDEAHFLHRVGLSWFEAVFALRRKRTIAATGTPARNRMRSLYGVLSALQGTPRPWGNIWDFRRRYCGAYQTDYGWQDGQPTNQEELAERVATVAISVDWSHPEVQGLRPPIKRMADRITLKPRDRAELSEAALKASYRNGKRQVIVWLNEQRKRLGQAKLADIKQHYPEHQFGHDQHARAIWWCWYKDSTAKELAEHFRKKTTVPVDLVTGSVTPKRRREILDEWKYGDPEEPRILVATLASMSAAANLITAEAAYFVEYDWSPLNIAQAEKRHHRPGNKFPEVYAYYFYLEETLEERMLNTLLDKVQEQDKIIYSEDEKEQIGQILGKDERVDYTTILDQVAQRLIEEG